jgi:very-short-patch-repair endonuclease
MEALLQGAGLPSFVREHVFSTKRKFRFDFAWPELKIGIEIEGAIWKKGGHSTGKGITRDIEKGNLATLEGWKLLRYSTTMLEKEASRVLEEVTWLVRSTTPMASTRRTTTTPSSRSPKGKPKRPT